MNDVESPNHRKKKSEDPIVEQLRAYIRTQINIIDKRDAEIARLKSVLERIATKSPTNFINGIREFDGKDAKILIQIAAYALKSCK